MKNIVKASLFLFIYQIIYGLAYVSGEVISAEWAKLLISFVCAFFCLFISGLISFAEGRKARKILHTNDVLRKRIVETGDDIKLESGEYKPYNGIFITLFSYAPLIIVLIINLFLGIFSGAESSFVSFAVKMLGGYSYQLYYVLTGICGVWQYNFAFIGIVVAGIVTTLFYVLGSKKEELIYDQVKNITGGNRS